MATEAMRNITTLVYIAEVAMHGLAICCLGRSRIELLWFLIKLLKVVEPP